MSATGSIRSYLIQTRWRFGERIEIREGEKRNQIHDSQIRDQPLGAEEHLPGEGDRETHENSRL